MATGKRFYWIKLKESFMTSDSVDFLMEQPSGANYVVLYQMLCLKTINTEGRLSRRIGEFIIPYDPEKIARDCKWFSVDTVRVALNLYKSLGLIYEDKDGVLALTDHHNLVGSETDAAARMRALRAQQESTPRLPAGEQTSEQSANIVTPENREEILDIRDIDNRDSEDTSSTPQAEAAHCPFAKIKELYHSICVSFPKIVQIDGNRKTAVAARWRTYKSIDVFDKLFRIAEGSSFLKGANDRNWHADFDWMMKPSNFTKILEHKYDDSSSGEHKLTGALGTLARMYEEAGNDGTGNN